MKTITNLMALTAVVAFAPAATADTLMRYRATLDNTGAIAPNGATSTEFDMTGVADFVLTIPSSGGSPTLAYDVRFEGVDFGLTNAADDDITAMHIHDTTGVANSAGTPHVLNIFGFPSVDDDQAVVDAIGARITGVWDDTDLTDPAEPHAGNPMANSDTLSSMLGALEAGELYLMLHTNSPNALPNTPGITIGGQIRLIPEPSAAMLLIVGWVARRRR